MSRLHEAGISESIAPQIAVRRVRVVAADERHTRKRNRRKTPPMQGQNVTFPPFQEKTARKPPVIHKFTEKRHKKGRVCGFSYDLMSLKPLVFTVFSCLMSHVCYINVIFEPFRCYFNCPCFL